MNKKPISKTIDERREGWTNLTNALSEAMDSLFTSVEACNILKNEQAFDKDILQGYYNSAQEIKDEILAINDKIAKTDLTKDENLLTLDYVEVCSEVTQVESLSAALVHDTVSDMISFNITANSDDLSEGMAKLEKLGLELVNSTKQGEENGQE